MYTANFLYSSNEMVWLIGNTYISHPLYCAYRVSKLLKARFFLFRFARLLGGFDFVINCARKSP